MDGETVGAYPQSDRHRCLGNRLKLRHSPAGDEVVMQGSLFDPEQNPFDGKKLPDQSRMPLNLGERTIVSREVV